MKTLKSLFLALTITLTMTVSRPSQAAIGAIFSPALVTAGLYIAGAGVGVTGIAFVLGAGGDDRTQLDALGVGILGILGAVLGLVILDDTQTVAFSPLARSEARNLKLTELEYNSFNAEVDQINALAAFVDSELERMSKPTKEDSAALWSEVKDALSPEAFTALVKVTSQIYAK